ncbi:DUF7096 domain-containing protein [Halogranum rubrum]|uniref:DUF7096 domain-containing protein n=1 Tax=Halogranum rubrum TaxID=553466 RepID=UPI00067771CB|nr:hypothetical protein [Halogranum salarium]
MRPRSVLFAVFLLVSSGVGAASLPGLAASSPDSDALSSTADIAQNRTQTNVLTLTQSSVQRTNFTQSSANASAALTIRDTRISRQLNTKRTETTLDSVDVESERQAYIRRALTEVEIRTSELRQEEREAFRRHSTGELSTTGLTVQLARIDTASEQLAQNVTRLNDAAEDIEGFSVQTRVDAIQLELQTLRGPMRDHTAEAVRGEIPPSRVYASTTADGVVLTTISDDTYVREVYDGSRRVPTSNAQLTPEEIDTLVRQSYPTLWERWGSSGGSARESDVWITEIPYRRGKLTAFIDKDTPGRVFKEAQTLRLNRTPPTAQLNATRVGLRLTVHPSYPGGPMLIKVENARTGDPVRADVSIISPPQSNTDPVPIGTTNSSGALWAVSPQENFTVQAIKVDTQSVVDMRVQPVEPNRVGAPNGSSSSNGSTGSADVTESDEIRTVEAPTVSTLTSQSLAAPSLRRR